MGDQFEPVLRLENISVSYSGGKDYAAQSVSFSVPKGSAFVLLGSSGSGKSTVLKTINRLVPVTEGNIYLYGQNAREVGDLQLRRMMGYVNQGISLYPFLNVWENIALPLRVTGVSRRERWKRALEMLDLMELPRTFASRMVTELSGGQQQRVGVGRALVSGSKIILMDEPFSALDQITRETLQDQVNELKRQLGVTLLFVTHDLFEALKIADILGVMHQGHLEQHGLPKELLRNPKTDFVRDLIKRPYEQMKYFLDDSQ